MLKRFNDLVPKETTKQKDCPSDKVNSDGEDNDKSCKGVDVTKSVKKFHIDISPLNWERIEPIEKIYQRIDDNLNRNIERTYHILPSGVWTFVLAQAISQEKKDIPCRLIFKRNKVYENGEKYIVVTGKCATCQAQFDGFLKDKPELSTKAVRFEFEFTGIDYSLHEQNKQQKNVRICGDVLKELSAQQGPATLVSRNLLRQSVDGMFEMPTSRIPTANAIRCGRYNNKIQNRLDSCPIKALSILKQSYYNEWIRAIGMDPFFCIYVNTDQITLYKVYKKKHSKTSVSCDATGKVVHAIGMFSVLKIQ